MKYLNANEVFSKEILLEIQKNVSGKAVYIPNLNNERKKWGQSTGARNAILERNMPAQCGNYIVLKHANG